MRTIAIALLIVAVLPARARAERRGGFSGTFEGTVEGRVKLGRWNVRGARLRAQQRMVIEQHGGRLRVNGIDGRILGVSTNDGGDRVVRVRFEGPRYSWTLQKLLGRSVASATSDAVYTFRKDGSLRIESNDVVQRGPSEGSIARRLTNGLLRRRITATTTHELRPAPR